MPLLKRGILSSTTFLHQSQFPRKIQIHCSQVMSLGRIIYNKLNVENENFKDKKNPNKKLFISIFVGRFFARNDNFPV